MISAFVKSFLCVRWWCNLFSEIPWTLRTIFHMHNVIRKCIEVILRAKNEASLTFQKSFFWRLEWAKIQYELLKKAFWTIREASFLARKCFSMDSLSMLYIQKIILRVQGISEFNLQHHPTCRNDFTKAESDFCRF